MMIKQIFLKQIQQVLNKAISLDDSMPTKLHALEGKLIQIHLEPLQVSCFITFHSGEIVLIEQALKLPDTVIKSSPLGLIRLSLLPASKVRSLFRDEVKLSGDVE